MEASLGFGDEILGSGLAKGLYVQGKRAAFGDGKKIIWGPWAEEIFRHNPNVARRGDEHRSDLVWISHYKGNRLYNRLDREKNRWAWNYQFKAAPGEIFFSSEEKSRIEQLKSANRRFILVEPNVSWHKSVAVNKDWGLQNYQAVVNLLLRDGHEVVQTKHGRDKLKGVKFVTTPKFRDVLAVMTLADVALVPEGGLHHGAAAVGVPAVVLFGGFIPPVVVGYGAHINLAGGTTEFCGSLSKCQHCRDAMAKISVEEVYQSMKKMIG
jgi:hypothetical protein